MSNLNPITNKLSEEERKVSYQNSSRILAEFFNGEVSEIDEEFKYDT